jgi:hypothetical protein
VQSFCWPGWPTGGERRRLLSAPSSHLPHPPSHPSSLPHYSPSQVDHIIQQQTNLELGFPANLVHIIDPNSFLYNLSLLVRAHCVAWAGRKGGRRRRGLGRAESQRSTWSTYHLSSHFPPPHTFPPLPHQEMDTRMMEILVFVDGIDAMTSRHMSARCSYSTSDIIMNQVCERKRECV